ncbi:ester cyclase [Streptomyces sp. NP160]|uniref:ester cyclase n=1 Tax=Streptomyces sp. NP160 TaxID=2586637 RepID=UPI001119EF51|nr:ester cyclase [Streptomyces sp. NP160]TNM67100.1 ester cyclase [Streptomyces sp. NP160]
MTAGHTGAEAVYARYLLVLDERRWEDLGAVVHDEVTHDGRLMTREQFADLLREDVATIPDLRYELRALVVDGDHLAARLWFDCTPVRPFRGVDTRGQRVAFAEHAFYELVDGRIRSIESVVDVDAVRRQVQGG